MPARLAFRSVLPLLAVFAVFGFAPKGGFAADEPVCDADCLSVVYDWVAGDVEHYLPFNRLPAERFDTAAACQMQRGPEPAVQAAVLAPLYPDYIELDSTQNDAKLLKDFFTERGVAPEFLTIADGPTITRERMVEILGGMLPCVRERDQVVLVLTGEASSYDRSIAPRAEDLAETMCAEDEKPEDLAALCETIAQMPQAEMDKILATFRQAQTDHDEMVFFASDVKLDTSEGRNGDDTRVVGLGALDISNFITQVRNRGADAIVLVDTNYAAAFNLLDIQRWSVKDGGWFWNTAWEDEPPEQDFNDELVPLFGTGHFAAYYTSANDQISQVAKVGEGDSSETLGHLVLAFTEAVRDNPDGSLVDVARFINKSIRDTGAAQNPMFAASSKALKLLAPAEAGEATGSDIEIISPSPKRGASGVEEKTFTLVGRYTGSGKAARAIVDGDLVAVDGNGQFRREITDTSGKLSVAIRVLSNDFTTLATAELKLREAGDTPVVSTGTRKLALVIANQTYSGSDAFPQLKTPVNDAEAVAVILRERFGFSTEITTGKKPLDLFLKDAGKAQIQQVLFELRQRLTPDDQLIVYYAGHGENDKDLGAYWVPVDGQPKADFTWIAAEEITRELKRMPAGSVLVISDSCYAGGLSRGGVDGPVAEARDRYLAKASRLKSRQLMASGGEEPVEDGGGGGHSVFAKALIEALQTMPGDVFTASELFEQKVKPAVISAANAMTEGQTPGFSRIAKAGDEPGSEFVFQVQP